MRYLRCSACSYQYSCTCKADVAAGVSCKHVHALLSFFEKNNEEWATAEKTVVDYVAEDHAYCDTRPVLPYLEEVDPIDFEAVHVGVDEREREERTKAQKTANEKLDAYNQALKVCF